MWVSEGRLVIMLEEAWTSDFTTGSTSVPGLAAKPVLDVDIVVVGTPYLEPVRKALVEKGKYEFMGELGIPGRYAFRKYEAAPARNLYVCIAGSQSLRNHLLVRDMCRRDVRIRDVYGRKKQELAEKEWASVDDYCEAKNDTILEILGQAGMAADDWAEIRARNTATVGS
jgi:GrpB-like predicted nucleotidyltransferase (UPF0157 family)